jgi:hypothetical protein
MAELSLTAGFYQTFNQNVRLSYQPDAEVFNATKPLHSLARRIVRILRDESDTRVTVWVLGETSSGKETTGGQLLHTVINQPSIRKLRPNPNSDNNMLALRTHSQIGSIRACKERGLIVTPTPFHTPQEYDMADRLTGNIAALERSSDRELRIFEVQGIYHRGKDGINLGTGALRRTLEAQRGNLNEYNFLVMPVTRWEIQKASMKARRPIRQIATGELQNVDPNQLLGNNNVSVDITLDETNIAEFNAGYGTDLAVYRGNPVMDTALFEAAASGEIEEPVTIQDIINWNHRLFTNATPDMPPGMINAWDAAWNKRIRAQVALYKSMTERDFNADPDDAVIFPATFLPEQTIHLFRQLMNVHRYSPEVLSAQI